jgi:hypothetical protein
MPARPKTRRRDLLKLGLFAAAPSRPLSAAAAPLVVPVHRVLDKRANCTKEQLDGFWRQIWPEAVRDLSRCGIQVASTDQAGEIRRSPSSRPIFTGVKRGLINLVLTREIPLAWSKARGLAGTTTIWEGYHVCVIALDYAHGHRIPFIGVNTCLHELLHALMQDVFVTRATSWEARQREIRVEWLATRLWLFKDGSGIRESAEAYLQRLRSAATTGVTYSASEAT